MKKAKDIAIDDRVKLENGDIKTVISVSSGFYRGSTLIEWRGGWSCVPNSETLEIA